MIKDVVVHKSLLGKRPYHLRACSRLLLRGQVQRTKNQARGPDTAFASATGCWSRTETTLNGVSWHDVCRPGEVSFHSLVRYIGRWWTRSVDSGEDLPFVDRLLVSRYDTHGFLLTWTKGNFCRKLLFGTSKTARESTDFPSTWIKLLTRLVVALNSTWY
jgi:hypothetical protein